MMKELKSQLTHLGLSGHMFSHVLLPVVFVQKGSEKATTLTEEKHKFFESNELALSLKIVKKSFEVILR